MPLLKTALVGKIRSLGEVFAVAEALEREAANRYAELAVRAQTEGNPELARLFERLSAEESKRAAAVERWSRERGGAAPAPAVVKWDLPDTFDEDVASELASSKIASAYRVLSLAVRNEERAFAFWSYVAAEAREHDVKAAAEQMARDELDHISSLRQARREAYRAERKTDAHRPAASPIERLAACAAIERVLADRLDELAARLRPEEAERARRFALEAREMANAAGAAGSSGDGSTIEGVELQAVAERLVENYLDIADLSRDETTAATAQSLASRAIARLAWLRRLG